MDLPFTPKLFKKAELYQELLRLEERNGTRIEWLLEKALLEWAHKGHWYLAQPLSKQFVYDRLRERANLTNGLDKEALAYQTDRVMENLVEYKWAERVPIKYMNVTTTELTTMPRIIPETYIKITVDGMLMAELITEIKTQRNNRFYSWFGIGTWVIFGMTLLALFFGTVKYGHDFIRIIWPAPPTPIEVRFTPAANQSNEPTDAVAPAGSTV